MGETPERGSVEVMQVQKRTESSMSVILRDEPVVVGLQDHFTLPTSSNLVRFRSRKNAARVFSNRGMQMILEETYDVDTKTTTISAKSLWDETIGVQFLRLLYTITCALFTGFFFVFCLQMLLFLVLDFAVVSGVTEGNELNVGKTIGVVLAIIVFVGAFSEALVISGAYIYDMWSGHYLVRQFIFKRLPEIAIEWIFFTAFLLLPLVVMCFSLLAGSAQWWSNTAITWFGCVLGFFVIFCINVVFFEVKAAYDFADNIRDDDSDKRFDVIRRCIVMRQRHKYSGKLQNNFLARSYFNDSEDTENTENSKIFEDSRFVVLSWWAKITSKCPEWMFKPLEEPVRLFTIEDVQDFRPFLTQGTWGLEKIFCRPPNSRYIAIVQGPGSLTKAQVRSSLMCSIIGTGLVILCTVAFLVWFEIPGAFVAFAFVIALIFSWNALRNTRNLFKVAKDILDIKDGKMKEMEDDEENVAKKDEPEEADASGAQGPKLLSDESQRIWEKLGAEPSEAIYLVSEYKRINKATKTFCWIMFALEVFFFYVYPLVTLLMIDWSLAIIFIISATISRIRHFINAAVVIEETGNMNLVGGETESEIWENKSRLNTIIENITAAKSRSAWVSILGGCGFAFLAIFLGAVGSSTANTFEGTYTYLPNFYYPPQTNDMRYQTCTMSNLNGGFGPNSTLLDFTYMASIAYFVDNNTQPALNEWFGPSGTEAIDEIQYVKDWRAANDNNDIPVFFKLFSFPQQRLAMLVIRGTTNNWDMLADTQLWSAAGLMQGLRAILPAGEIWTPIFDQLVHWINVLQAQTLDQISFYKVTTAFAKHLKADPQFSSVQVTGHSLGGGLSMITGAQSKIPAVGLSGPNALISGRSFNPPVTKEEMNQYTFNIVPRRDIVPMLDDKADQFQYIRCESAPSDFVGCHFAKRSLCEIMYTCGSGNRPAICECYNDYGYPKPVTDGDEDFDTLCAKN